MTTTTAAAMMTTAMNATAGPIAELVDNRFALFTFRMVAPAWEYVLRITLCFCMMLLVGIERQAQRKPLGFGPFSMIGVGSCSAAILAIIVAPTAPLVLMSGTVSSIGFLGAGSLIKGSDGGVQGFTTGALLVLASFVGINMGAGMYMLSALLYTFLWIILCVDRWLAHKGFGVHGFRVELTFTIGEDPTKKQDNIKLQQKLNEEAAKAAAEEARNQSNSGDEGGSVDHVEMRSGVDDNESDSAKRRRRRRGGGGSVAAHAKVSAEPLLGEHQSSLGDSAYQMQLSSGLVGADRLLHALDRAMVKYNLVSYNVDGIGNEKQTQAKLVFTVHARRAEVWRTLSSLNITLGAEQEDALANDHSDRIRIIAVNVTLP